MLLQATSGFKGNAVQATYFRLKKNSIPDILVVTVLLDERYIVPFVGRTVSKKEQIKNFESYFLVNAFFFCLTDRSSQFRRT